MNKQFPPAAPAAAHRMPSDTEARPAAFAVSPAIGPLPAIYVPPSPGQATAPSRLWHATVRAVGWVLQEIGYRPGAHRD
jgi:hypothetical protein